MNLAAPFDITYKFGRTGIRRWRQSGGTEQVLTGDHGTQGCDLVRAWSLVGPPGLEPGDLGYVGPIGKLSLADTRQAVLGIRRARALCSSLR